MKGRPGVVRIFLWRLFVTVALLVVIILPTLVLFLFVLVLVVASTCLRIGI